MPTCWIHNVLTWPTVLMVSVGPSTAALFLQKFVGDIPWAHVDMYAWKGKAQDCYSEAGGQRPDGPMPDRIPPTLQGCLMLSPSV